jgi:hypothetical protein
MDTPTDQASIRSTQSASLSGTQPAPTITVGTDHQTEVHQSIEAPSSVQTHQRSDLQTDTDLILEYPFTLSLPHDPYPDPGIPPPTRDELHVAETQLRIRQLNNVIRYLSDESDATQSESGLPGNPYYQKLRQDRRYLFIVRMISIILLAILISLYVIIGSFRVIFLLLIVGLVFLFALMLVSLIHH